MLLKTLLSFVESYVNKNMYDAKPELHGNFSDTGPLAFPSLNASLLSINRDLAPLCGLEAPVYGQPSPFFDVECLPEDSIERTLIG